MPLINTDASFDPNTLSSCFLSATHVAVDSLLEHASLPTAVLTFSDLSITSHTFLAHRVNVTFKFNSSLNYTSFHSLWPSKLEYKSSLYFGKPHERSATWNVSQHYPYSIKMQWIPTGANERWLRWLYMPFSPVPPTKRRRKNKVKFTYFTLLRKTE